MKTYRATAVVVAVMLVLSLALNGCSFTPQSIESLMRPPYFSTEKELEKSLNSLLGSDISLRSPETGDYHSAITLRDLDGDKQTEAVVFYVKNTDLSYVRMSILQKNEDKWQISADFAGNGSGISRLDFSDLNGDGADEMLVSWFLFDNKVDKSLAVYSCNRTKGALNVSVCGTESYNLMRVEDMFDTGEQQLLLAFTDSSKTPLKTTLRLIGLNTQAQISLICETRLDSRITSLVSIAADSTDGSPNPRIFIDADIPDNQIITEVLIWNEPSRNFNLIFNDKLLQTNILTQRTNNLFSTDIDGDGEIEIPLRLPLSESRNGDTSMGYLLEWCAVAGGGLLPEMYYAVNPAENYKLFFPDDWKNRIFVNSDAAIRRWNFVDTEGEKLFDITVFELDGWDEKSAGVTEVLYIQNDLVYACTVTVKGEKQGINAVDLLKYFEFNS